MRFSLTLAPTASVYVDFQLRDSSGDRSDQTFVLFSGSTGGFVTQTFPVSFAGAFGGPRVDPTDITRITMQVSQNFFATQPMPNPVSLSVDNLVGVGAAAAPEPGSVASLLAGAALTLAGIFRVRRRSAP